jgi:YggT family protein
MFLQKLLFYVVTTLFELYLWVLLLRVLLQWTRADFYNPFSQLVWKLTQPIVRWLQPVIPRWRNFDAATLFFALVVSFVYIEALIGILETGHHYSGAEVLKYSVLKLIALTLNLYTFSMIVQAVLSWVGPGISNPAGSVLWSINEPLLRPVRRVVPPTAGLDLSPLIMVLLLQLISQLIPLGIFR